VIITLWFDRRVINTEGSIGEKSRWLARTSTCAVYLFLECSSHKVESYKDKFFVSGGAVQTMPGKPIQHSDPIYEVKLVPPYSSMLATLPQPRCDHGMEIFDDKLFVIGGSNGAVTSSVVRYELAKRECKEMPQMSHPVCEMATVSWKNNVLLIGALDARGRILNELLLYDVISGRSQTLPSMKRKRYGCLAVLSGDVFVVLGGRNENNEYLKSIESFDLKRQAKGICLSCCQDKPLNSKDTHFSPKYNKWAQRCSERGSGGWALLVEILFIYFFFFF